MVGLHLRRALLCESYLHPTRAGRPGWSDIIGFRRGKGGDVVRSGHVCEACARAGDVALLRSYRPAALWHRFLRAFRAGELVPMPVPMVLAPVFYPPAGGIAAANRLLYGDGFDGDITIAANASAARSILADHLTVNATKVYDVTGFPVHCKTKAQLDGFMSADGNAANGSIGGVAKGGGPLPASQGGANGQLGAGVAGQAQSQTWGGSSGAGGAGTGGAGGGAGVATPPWSNVVAGNARTLGALMVAQFATTAGSMGRMGVSPSGGSGGGDGAQTGGGAGAGGGFGALAAPEVVVAATGGLTARGGPGGTPTLGNTGGGGGGGGGVQVVITDKLTAAGTVSVAGGAKGLKHGAGSADGNNGNVGTLLQYVTG